MSEFISPGQCRAARALLGWRQPDLASRADVGVTTLADFERGARKPFPNNVRAIRVALEEAGLVFLDGGVVFAIDTMPKSGVHATLRKGIPRTVGDMVDPMSDGDVYEDHEEEADELGTDQG